MTLEIPSDYVYLDWAATAPLSQAAADAMAPFFNAGPAGLGFNMNANSLHSPGRAAFERMETARKSIARGIGASRPSEIIFTSGATEADNAAIKGILRALAANKETSQRRKVITSAIEHDAILAPLQGLEGFEVVKLAPSRDGFIDPCKLEEAIDESTALVSIQMANGEIGSIQPIEQLASIAHEHGALFHTDATQALGKVPFDAQRLGIDAASFSAHKIGGPKGVGALYLRKGTPFNAIMEGGGQENGHRSTTQNVAGIVGFAAALDSSLGSMEEEVVRQRALRDHLLSRLNEMDGIIATVGIQVGSKDHLPNIVSVLSRDHESQTLILRLDRLGFGVSGGSACSSNSLDPSHVLTALGYTPDEAYGELRISFGESTTEEQLDRFVEALGTALS